MGGCVPAAVPSELRRDELRGRHGWPLTARQRGNPAAQGWQAMSNTGCVSYPLVIRTADSNTIGAVRPQLSRLLADGFEAGAALGFAPPLTESDLASYWSQVADEVAAGVRHVLVASVGDELVGCVQLVPDRAPNGRHRGEVRTLAVRSTARQRGVAARLMSAVEGLAADLGLSLLHLTTHVGLTAAGVYRRLGWTELGVIPGYAMAPDGLLVDNVFFWKQVGAVGSEPVAASGPEPERSAA